MKIVLVLAVIGLALGKPAPQGFGKPTQGAIAGLPQRKLWLTIDDNSLEVFNPLNPSPTFNPLNPSPTFKSNVAYNKVGGKAVAVPNYYYGSSEELYYGNPSFANAKAQFKSLPSKAQGSPNFYYDNSGELNIVPDPAMVSQVAYAKAQFKSQPLNTQGAPNFYYDNSGELNIVPDPAMVAYAKAQFKSQPLNTQGNPNFYYDNSGELNFVPDPAMVSPAYSQFYSSLNLPVGGPNAPRYYIDSSGELGVASDYFMTRLVQNDQNSNLYRDNSGELLYVYPKGTHPGNSPSGTPVAPVPAAPPASAGLSGSPLVFDTLGSHIPQAHPETLVER